MPNISRSKGNQAMKFGQLIEYNERKFFFSNSCRRGDRSLFFKKKDSFRVKDSKQHFSFKIFWKNSTWNAIKANCIRFETADPEICSILTFYKDV